MHNPDIESLTKNAERLPRLEAGRDDYWNKLKDAWASGHRCTDTQNAVLGPILGLRAAMGQIEAYLLALETIAFHFATHEFEGDVSHSAYTQHALSLLSEGVLNLKNYLELPEESLSARVGVYLTQLHAAYEGHVVRERNRWEQARAENRMAELRAERQRQFDLETEALRRRLGIADESVPAGE